MPRQTLLATTVVWLGLILLVDARTWTDSTGHYRIEADLIAFNDAMAVLKKADGQLAAVPVEKLSQEDQSFLKSKEAGDRASRSADAEQTWTLESGMKVVGRVVDYAKKEITFQQRRGKIYVNDRLFDNLPEVYQKMAPKIVSHFENVPIRDRRALDAWAMKLRGEPRTFACEGVLLELENGDCYGVPFFFFSPEDRKILEPGWRRWLAADKDRARREQETLLVQSQAQAYQQDRMANRQIAMMQLQMQGYEAGLFDLWEVRLVPGPGSAGPPLVVVVPARDSRAAAAEAARRNPGYVPGPVAKVVRKY